MKKTIAALLIVAVSAFGTKNSDSLETLHFILKGEMKKKNKVLVLKNKAALDSLLRQNPGQSRFNQIIRDTAFANEIKTSEEFRKYWRQVEAQSGLTELHGQMNAHDVDKSIIPKVMMFDSSVVIYPGWIIIRQSKKHRPR